MPDTRERGTYVPAKDHLVVSAWVRGFLVDAVVLGWAGRMVFLTWKSDLGSHLEWVTASDVERRQRPILTLERGLHERDAAL